jgi:hypothetical protein
MGQSAASCESGGNSQQFGRAPLPGVGMQVMGLFRAGTWGHPVLGWIVSSTMVFSIVAIVAASPNLI